MHFLRICNKTGHLVPPLAAGVIILRSLCVKPLPQVTLQGVHGDQGLTTHLTGSEERDGKGLVLF